MLVLAREASSLNRDGMVFSGLGLHFLLGPNKLAFVRMRQKFFSPLPMLNDALTRLAAHHMREYLPLRKTQRLFGLSFGSWWSRFSLPHLELPIGVMVMPEVFRAPDEISGALQNRIANMKHRVVGAISEPRSKALFLRGCVHGLGIPLSSPRCYL